NTGYYSYQPYLTLSGSNFTDTSSSSALKLTQFTTALWFKTTMDVPVGENAYIANKGGNGVDAAGSNMNYGLWMTSLENIEAGFETTGGTDYALTSPSTYS